LAAVTAISGYIRSLAHWIYAPAQTATADRLIELDYSRFFANFDLIFE
jgi:hypothetical protein